MSDLPDVLAIVGPTASGKTAVAEELGVRLGGEIVSADSMQVYRGMDIGTAKPPADARRVPYHCIDLVEPGTAYSAALFQDCARSAISSVRASGSLPMVVGGTGLYVRAALDDMRFPEGAVGSLERDRLEALSREQGPEALYSELVAVDPASAALIHPNNTRRVIRALEMRTAGVSYAEQRAGFTTRHSVYGTFFLGLGMDREELYARIDERVEGMMRAGFLDEVAGLLERGYRAALTSAQAIGYKELVGVLEGERGLGEAVEHVKRATRRYAKRQMTWFRADPRVRWLDATGLDGARAAEAAAELLESYMRPGA